LPTWVDSNFLSFSTRLFKLEKLKKYTFPIGNIMGAMVWTIVLAIVGLAALGNQNGLGENGYSGITICARKVWECGL